MKRDCKNCPCLELFDKVFPPVIHEKSYDLTCTDHGCGCFRYYLYDDTPGYREKDEWFDNEQCILNDPDDSYELPLYKGTYEDLLKTR